MSCPLSSRRFTASICTANVVISIVSTCLYFKHLWSLDDSPAFAVQLDSTMQALLCGAGLVLLDTSGLAPRWRQHSIALWRWLELAWWFSLQNTLEIAAVDGLGSENGSLCPVLQQAVIPLTLFISSSLLSQHYRWCHWLGAALVIGGIAASYGPIAAARLKEAGSVRWGWACVYLISRVPQSLANVRCEALFRAAMRQKGGGPSCEAVNSTVSSAALLDSTSDASSLMGHVVPQDEHPLMVRSLWDGLRTVLRAGFWTALLGLVFNAVSSLILSYARGHHAVSLLDEYRDGAICLLNLNLTTPTNRGGAHGRCSAAAAATAAFAVPGVLFAVSEFQVIQSASAATYFLLLALELPLQATALSMPLVMGHLASDGHHSLFYGVPLIITGLLAWAYAERRP